MKIIVLIASLLFCSSLPAQNAYLDADNFPQAVGLLEIQLLNFKGLEHECSARYPDLAPRMSELFENWKTKEHEVLSRVACYSAQFERARPGGSEKLAAMSRDALEKMFKRFDSMAPHAPKEAGDVVKHTCLALFEDLASGVWRKRIPKAYGLIEGDVWPRKCRSEDVKE